ncbi:MAG: acetylxylan esterase, partial [Cyclobacteriaceae bacterium]|nr:acetylxylan esterase [Cyclobacteriaceae bacterium]
MKIIKSGDIVLKGKHNKPIVVDYRYAENKDKMPLILFIHGFKGFKDWGYFNMMSDYYVKNGFVFVKMNFSHNGTTPDSPTDYADLEAFGNNNFTKELDDIEVVLDFICSNEFELFNAIDYNRLSIKGHSRGGGTALLKASEDSRIKNVVTLAGINNFRNNASEETLALWKKEGVQ